MSKKKRILLCTSSTVPQNAGDGKNAFNFAKTLKKYGQKTKIFSLNKHLAFLSYTVIDSIPIYRAPYFNKNILQKIISRIIILPYFLFFVVRNDIIVIYGKIIGHLVLILIGRVFGKKVIFRSTLFGFDDFNSLVKTRFQKLVHKKIYNLANIYFSLTPAFTNTYLSNLNKKKKIFESCQGVDTSVFYPVNENKRNELRKKLNLPEKEKIIISVGFLIKRKGFDEIFEVLSKLNYSFLYVVVGDYEANLLNLMNKKSKEMQRLYEKGKNLLSNKIIFTGAQNNVHEYLQASDIFLLNSSKEGLSNALLEAMACGVVPVVRKIAGVDNYIIFNENNGLLFSSADEMEKHIEELFVNKSIRKKLSENASEFIKSNCSLEWVTEKFLQKMTIS